MACSSIFMVLAATAGATMGPVRHRRRRLGRLASRASGFVPVRTLRSLSAPHLIKLAGPLS